MTWTAVAVVALLAVGLLGATRFGWLGTASATGTLASLTPAAYHAQFVGKPHILLDVRTPAEFASGHIAGAVNIPVDDLARRLAEVSQDVPVIAYCRTGRRSGIAGQLLERAGYTDVYNLGGIGAWQAAGYPVE